MTRDPDRLTQPFDLLIIGGGIVGAGIAWDASLRGLSCALVEQGDFASGASSKTTKLIHGGIRYLEQLEFGLVRQALRERGILLRSAPDLVRPLSFLIPVVGNSPRPWPLVRIGAALYDFLAGRSRIQRHRVLTDDQIPQAEPLLSNSQAQRAVLYSDAQMDDARLVFVVLQAAADQGAVLLNYCSAAAFLQESGKMSGAQVEDRLTGRRYEVKAQVVVNAAGPWVDRVRRMVDPSLQPIVRPSKGIHLLYKELGLKQALLLSSPTDQRIFFLIPWKGMTLIGTTDTDYQGDPGDAAAESSDVAYLLEETNRLLPHLHLSREGVITTFAGVRPLVAQEKKDPWAVSRSHRVHEDPGGLISLVGGKYTTFRAIAQDVVDRVSRRFPHKGLRPCRTEDAPLGSASSPLGKEGGDEGDDSKWAKPLCPHHPFRLSDVRRAVEQEMAVTLSDLLWRRLQIGYSPCQGLDALEAAGECMGRLLGWDAAEISRQIACYRAEVAAARAALQRGTI